MPPQDGPACRIFPSNVATVRWNTSRNSVPLLIPEIVDSRLGGRLVIAVTGTRVAFKVTSRHPITMTSSRTGPVPPRGLLGAPRLARSHYVNASGSWPRWRKDLEPGDEVTFDTPGGGGLGAPRERDAASREADLLSGLVTPAGAAAAYGSGAADRGRRGD